MRHARSISRLRLCRLVVVTAVLTSMSALTGAGRVGATAVYPGCTIDTTYQLGARSDAVLCIEQALAAQRFQWSRVDTYFGTTTVTAVRNFQWAKRLLPLSGVVDERTATALGIWGPASPPTTTAPPTTTVPPTTTTLPPTTTTLPPTTTTLPPTTTTLPPTTTVPPTTTPPTTTVPPAAPTGIVTIVSDSAMAGVRWNGALGGFRGATFNPQLQSCRRLVSASCRGREGFRPLTAKGEIDGLPVPGPSDVLVVATGYNDVESTFSSDFDVVIAAARQKGFKHIAWLTYRSRVSYGLPRSSRQRFANYGLMNSILRAKVGSGAYPEVVLWDLDAYTATGASGWFTVDGVHERRLGSWGVADWVSRHVAAMAGRPCPMPWVPGGPIESPCPNPDTVVSARGLPNIRVLYGL